MNAVIIGANGQDGYYLSKLLSAQNINVIEISRSENYVKLNLTDYSEVSTFIRRYQPDYLFHLAANSTTRHEVWKENHDTICTGSLNILEALYEHHRSCKLFLSGSGLQFINKGVPIKETDEFYPSSQYSVSRIHSVFAARYYRDRGLKVYIGYLFNHDSPRRTEKHISRQIIDAVKRISRGSDEKLSIGAPSVRKEWGYAGDIVEGIWKLTSQDQVFEATIGTGKDYSIQQWIDTCFSLIDKDSFNYIESNQAFIPEYNVLVSDPSTINNLGWYPKVSFEQLATKMLTADE